MSSKLSLCCCLRVTPCETRGTYANSCRSRSCCRALRNTRCEASYRMCASLCSQLGFSNQKDCHPVAMSTIGCQIGQGAACASSRRRCAARSSDASGITSRLSNNGTRRLTFGSYTTNFCSMLNKTGITCPRYSRIERRSCSKKTVQC